MLNWIKWFLTAIGLMKRKPTTPTKPDPAPPELPISTKLPAPTFHGFWMRHGKLAYEREMTILQVGPSVHGCPPDEVRFGYEDNGSGPYQCKISILNRETDIYEAVYTMRGNRVDGQWFSDRSVVWFPMWSQDQPPYPLSASIVAKGCGPTPTPAPRPQPQNTELVTMFLEIKNAHGSLGSWKQSFEAVAAACE